MSRRRAPLGATTVATPGGIPALEPTAATPEQLDRLREILGRPEFRAAEGQGDLLAFLEPIRTLLGGMLLGAIRWLLAALGGTGDGPGYGLVGTAVAIVVIALVVFVRLSRGTVAAEGSVPGEQVGRVPRADEEWAHASALAAAGDLRGAIHHHYLAVLRRLDERGLLAFDRSLTNVEHLRRVRGNPGLLEPLRPLVQAFDRLWYGQASCSSDEYAEFLALARRTWELAR